jgi:hypothetical protein
MASATTPQNSGTESVSTPLPEFLKAHEVARILGCTVWSATQLCKKGLLPASKPMQAWLVDPADLQRYIEAHRNDADGEQAVSA